MQQVTLVPIEEEQQEVRLIPLDEPTQPVNLTPIDPDIQRGLERRAEPRPQDKYTSLVDRALGGFYGAAGGTFGMLSKAADWIHDKTGIAKGDAFKMLSEEYQNKAEYLGAKGYQGIPGDVASGVGTAGWDWSIWSTNTRRTNGCC